MAEDDKADPVPTTPDYIRDEPGFKTVTLTRSYDDGFDGKFNTVRLREPTYKDIFVDGIGQPFEWQPGREGLVYIAFPGVIAQYTDRILVSPDKPVSLQKLGPQDSLRIERAVIGFFTGSAS